MVCMGQHTKFRYLCAKPLINAKFDASCKARCLIIGLRPHLNPYFVYVSNEGSGESAHMHILV